MHVRQIANADCVKPVRHWGQGGSTSCRTRHRSMPAQRNEAATSPTERTQKETRPEWNGNEAPMPEERTECSPPPSADVQSRRAQPSVLPNRYGTLTSIKAFRQPLSQRRSSPACQRAANGLVLIPRWSARMLHQTCRHVLFNAKEDIQTTQTSHEIDERSPAGASVRGQQWRSRQR